MEEKVFRVYMQLVTETYGRRRGARAWSRSVGAVNRKCDRWYFSGPQVAWLKRIHSTTHLIWLLIIQKSWQFNTWARYSRNWIFCELQPEIVPSVADCVIESCVMWTLLSPSNYYNGFKRSWGEWTRYYWQEEMRYINSPSGIWNN